jgi:flavodoxin
MSILIVYDSVFGNTEQVARRMGEALADEDVKVLRVGNVRPEHLAGVEFLIVGSPTRQFNGTPEIMAFLAGLPDNSLEGIKATAFDTRVNAHKMNPIFRLIVNKGGYADKLIGAALKAKGAVVLPTGWFYVVDREGPMEAGEIERAGEWAKSVNQARKLV